MIPRELKATIVRPIRKTGERNHVLNYRPIFVVSVLNHITEKYVNKVVRGFISKYSILTDSQYGFRENISTFDLLEDFTDDIYENLDRGRYIMTIY